MYLLQLKGKSRKQYSPMLQIMAGSFMIIVLHNYLTIFQMCIMGLCVYLIATCQKILGVRNGMLFAQLKQDRIDEIVSEVKKIQKKRKKKGKKND